LAGGIISAPAGGGIFAGERIEPRLDASQALTDGHDIVAGGQIHGGQGFAQHFADRLLHAQAQRGDLVHGAAEFIGPHGLVGDTVHAALPLTEHVAPQGERIQVGFLGHAVPLLINGPLCGAIYCGAQYM
jgi:hypothetical protein